ncbi:hypothetical protein O181_072138 [Austropuccinia psidii MF-1]|uniref:Uncharacterized protein n=1 Tax=Austropuccinia psidii MF-1 TaxID=1389203 RepID=A0A9Q3F6V5_9BASI|nr:hypothetical protein [Austropuccinia psidii MF-1]
MVHLTNLRPIPFLGPGGPSGLPGASGPSSHHHGLWLHPFYYGGLGLNGLFGPFRPPYGPQTAYCGPCSVGPLGPFWPKSNEAKGANHKPQLGPPEPILAPNHNLPKNGQKDLRTQIGQESHIGHFKPLASDNHQSPPAQVQQASPSIQGKDSPSPMYSIPRIQAWCIYGIRYHYAPISLSNPMVMFSRPNYAILIQVPKTITHFEGSFSIPGGYQKTIQGCQPPGL